jgi:hypothetical protein
LGPCAARRRGPLELAAELQLGAIQADRVDPPVAGLDRHRGARLNVFGAKNAVGQRFVFVSAMVSAFPPRMTWRSST